MKPGPGVVGGAAGHVADAVLGNTIGFVTKKAQDALLGGLPEEATAGTFQETKKKQKGGKRGLRRLLFWRKAKVEATTEAEEGEEAEVEPEAPPKVLSEEEQAAIEARLEEALEGGFAVKSAKEALTSCLSDDACVIEDELEKQEQLGLIVRK